MLPVLAPKRALRQQPETLVIPELILIDRGVEEERAEEAHHAHHSFGRVGLLDERPEGAPHSEQANAHELLLFQRFKNANDGIVRRKASRELLQKSDGLRLDGRA